MEGRWKARGMQVVGKGKARQVEGKWKADERGRWKIGGRQVECKWKAGGRQVEASGRQVEGTWKARGRQVDKPCHIDKHVNVSICLTHIFTL